MTVGICTLDLYLPGCRSLKDKRQILRSLIDRLRSGHNVSVAEVDHQDLWQRAGLAIVAVASARGPLESLLERLLGEIEERLDGQIVDHSIEYL